MSDKQFVTGFNSCFMLLQFKCLTYVESTQLWNITSRYSPQPTHSLKPPVKCKTCYLLDITVREPEESLWQITPSYKSRLPCRPRRWQLSAIPASVTWFWPINVTSGTQLLSNGLLKYVTAIKQMRKKRVSPQGGAVTWLTSTDC